MDIPQRRFTKKLAERDISCSESQSSCDEDQGAVREMMPDLADELSDSAIERHETEKKNRYLGTLINEYDTL
jgi:hypothetical protein